MGEIGEEKVEIILKTIGPTRPSRIHVDPRIKVHDLRKLVADKTCIQKEDLRLILQGKALHDQNNGEDVYIKLTNSDSILAAVKPKGPVKHLQEDVDSDKDDDDLKFHLPQSASWWKRRLYKVLHDRLKLPDIILMAIFSLSLKTWILILLWFVMAPIAHRWDLGPVYILATGFALILLNLGRRQPGEASAYSIFNEDFRELPGTLNADRLDGDIRAGQF